MLIQFTVGNFRSFRENVTLSLVASDAVKHDPGLVVDGPGGLKVLRCAALYGANASGKSNLVLALGWLLRTCLRGRKPDSAPFAEWFALDPALAQKPSHFELVVGTEQRRYEYGLEIGSTVEAEWLYVIEDGKERALFERQGLEPTDTSGLSQDPSRTEFLRFVAQGTRPEQVFLAEARERNVAELNEVIELLRGLKPVNAGGRLVDPLKFVEAGPAEQQLLTELLRDAGTGITGLEVLANEVVDDADDFPDEGIFDRLNQMHATRKDNKRFDVRVLMAQRRNVLGEPVQFAWNLESEGTRRLAELAELARSSRKAFIIDELERSMHPVLVRRLLQRFLDLGAQGVKSQLIFTTHDTNLLERAPFGADSTWFMEKQVDGSSRLYSLAEFKPEQLEQLKGRIDDGYLEGRFGALPQPALRLVSTTRRHGS